MFELALKALALGCILAQILKALQIFSLLIFPGCFCVRVALVYPSLCSGIKRDLQRVMSFSRKGRVT